MTSRSKLIRVVLSVALASLLVAQDRVLAQQLLYPLIASDRAAGDEFGISVALSGEHVLVGADGNQDAGLWAGSAYLFDVGNGQQLFKLLPNDTAGIDMFGFSVAISGNRALVGAHGKTTLPSSFYHGAAYLFNTSTGQQLFKLKPLGLQPNDYFGYSVAIDGDYAVIGAVGDTAAGLWSGAAYIYDVPTGQMLRQLTPSDGAPYNNFGCSVAISGDLAIIGALYDNDKGNNAGAAYIYDVTTGLKLFKLHANDGSDEDYFGCSVAIQGHRAAVGAYGNHVFGVGAKAGAAYVFDVTTGQQIVRLLPSDGAPDDHFGRSVAISDGRVVVGANNDDDFGLDSGSAYAFEAGTGVELFKLLPNTGSPGDQFGWSVSAAEGRTVVGAYKRETSRGTAYAFGLVEPGVGFCFGDPGSGTPCPCANDNDGTVPGSGCDNGVFASGSHLSAAGNASAGFDSMSLVAHGAEPNNTGLFFQANNQVNSGAGNPFGDGLRCAGGGLVRLQIVTANAAGTASTTVPLAAKGGISPWDIKRYQYWYRTTTNPPCGLGVSDFNLSNGYEVMWLP